jgi:hypothetical protein
MSQKPMDRTYVLPRDNHEQLTIHEYDEPQKSPIRSIPAPSPSTPPTPSRPAHARPLQMPSPKRGPIRAMSAASSMDRLSRPERFVIIVIHHSLILAAHKFDKHRSLDPSRAGNNNGRSYRGLFLHQTRPCRPAERTCLTLDAPCCSKAQAQAQAQATQPHLFLAPRRPACAYPRMIRVTAVSVPHRSWFGTSSSRHSKLDLAQAFFSPLMASQVGKCSIAYTQEPFSSRSFSVASGEEVLTLHIHTRSK